MISLLGYLLWLYQGTRCDLNTVIYMLAQNQAKPYLGNINQRLPTLQYLSIVLLLGSAPLYLSNSFSSSLTESLGVDSNTHSYILAENLLRSSAACFLPIG